MRDRKEQHDEWKEKFDLTDEIIAQALIVSEALFEVTLSPEDMESSESFEDAVRNVIAKVCDNPRAPNLLVSSIRRDTGRLIQLKMVDSNNDPLPICFFNYDTASKLKMRAAFTFFGESNREKASYLIDALTLDLMEDAGRRITAKDIAVIDVHFETLASSIYSATFVRKFLHYVKNTAFACMLNIRSMPRSTAAEQLEELLRPFGKYAARRSMQIDPCDVADVAASDMPVSCVVCSYPQLMSCTGAADQLSEQKPAFSKAGTLLVLRGLGSIDEIEGAKWNVFDGYAIDSDQGD